MNRWPDHDTFNAKFPDDTPIISVADIFLEEIGKLFPSVDFRFTEAAGADLCHFEVWRDDIDRDEDDRRERYREHVVLNFFDEGEGSKEVSGLCRCEGKLTDAARSALERALTAFGGSLTVRGPRGQNQVVHEFSRTAETPEISPFFHGVSELAELMPLHAAVEVMKVAAQPDARGRVLDVVERFALIAGTATASTRWATP